MKLDTDKIILDLANIGADVYLKKDISCHAGLINENIGLLNDFMDTYLDSESEGYKLYTTLAYQYYRYKDLLQ